MKLSEMLTARGFIQQFSAETLAEILDGEPRVIYHGIDPSADSAHAGNFVVWMMLKHLNDAGHKVVFLVGGGTGMIGDPKPDVERPLVEAEEVARRVEKIKAQAERLLGGELTFVNNYDWLGSVGLLPFLRDIGKHFTVNELIKKDAISARLASETGLSYTEFAYPLLQAYDFLMLYRSHGATVQVGGSDQWGNMVAGADLIRRVERAAAYAVTVPLIIDKTTGKKFGKSEGNAVWLDADKTTPFAFYQFWLNTADENVVDYLRLFTMLPLDEVAELEEKTKSGGADRAAQRVLAKVVTEFVHGSQVCAKVERASELLFGGEAVFSDEEQALLIESAPVTEVSDNTSLVDVLVTTGLSQSKREARTFIEDGAISIGQDKVRDVDAVVSAKTYGTVFRVQRGRRQVVLVKISE